MQNRQNNPETNSGESNETKTKRRSIISSKYKKIYQIKSYSGNMITFLIA